MKGKEEMGVLKSNPSKERKLRGSFVVGGFPSVSLNNLAILGLINIFSLQLFFIISIYLFEVCFLLFLSLLLQ